MGWAWDLNPFPVCFGQSAHAVRFCLISQTQSAQRIWPTLNRVACPFVKARARSRELGCGSGVRSHCIAWQCYMPTCSGQWEALLDAEGPRKLHAGRSYSAATQKGKQLLTLWLRNPSCSGAPMQYCPHKTAKKQTACQAGLGAKKQASEAWAPPQCRKKKKLSE